MALNKIFCRVVVLMLTLFSLPAHAEMMQGDPQQIIQINTKFSNIIGKPSWLLILRDASTGQILPYLYDIKNNDNYWIAFSLTHTYRVIASQLKFNATTTINDFCHLEGAQLTRISMSVRLTGILTADPSTSFCHVLRYKQDVFPIVRGDDTTS